jgi:hypothetical protein
MSAPKHIKSIKLNNTVKMKRGTVTKLDTVTNLSTSYEDLVITTVTSTGVNEINILNSLGLCDTLDGGIVDAFIRLDKKHSELVAEISTEKVNSVAAAEAKTAAYEASVLSDFSTLTTRLSSEEVARASADDSLSTLLTAEVSDRTSADDSLSTLLTAEVSDRTSADSSLSTLLTAEVSDRTSADDSLSTLLSSEELARASADDSLTSRLSSEELARASADDSLTSRLSSEELARASADTSLTTRLFTEEKARASTDTELKNVDTQLKTLVAGSDLDIVTLTSMVDVYKTANPNVINAVNDHKNKINEMIDRLANFFSDDEDSGFCVNKLSATQL